MGEVSKGVRCPKGRGVLRGEVSYVKRCPDVKGVLIFVLISEMS